MILDGAMGSNLIAAGMPMRGCAEQWVCDHPDVVTRLQKQYLDAGSHILYAATFGANRIRLASHGLEDEIERLNTIPVQLARAIATPAASPMRFQIAGLVASLSVGLYA